MNLLNTPSMGAVFWNTTDLEANVVGLTIIGSNSHLPPVKTLGSQLLAFMNKNKVTTSFFTGKKIILTCYITRSSRTFLEQSLDQLWPLISGVEQSLYLTESNAQRKYTATWSDFQVKEQSGGYMKFDLIFTCSDNYGYDPTYTTLIDQSNITTSTQTLTMGDVDGSAEYQAPIITAYITALTGGTSAQIGIGNAANGQTVYITRTWLAGDQIEIDSQNRTVKVNGLLVDFTGAFPEWKPKSIAGTGQSKITWTDGLTTRTVRIKAIYYRRWA